MSRYAYLVCPASKQMVFLGKIVQPPAPGSPYFHMGDRGKSRNSENASFMKVIMKFLAQNLNKELLVVSEEQLELLNLEPLDLIGDDPANGTVASDYIADFLG